MKNEKEFINSCRLHTCNELILICSRLENHLNSRFLTVQEFTELRNITYVLRNLIEKMQYEEA